MAATMLTTREAAERLRVSTKTVQRWDDAGLLESVRTPGGQRRYSADAVDAIARGENAEPTIVPPRVPGQRPATSALDFLERPRRREASPALESIERQPARQRSMEAPRVLKKKKIAPTGSEMIKLYCPHGHESGCTQEVWDQANAERVRFPGGDNRVFPCTDCDDEGRPGIGLARNRQAARVASGEGMEPAGDRDPDAGVRSWERTRRTARADVDVTAAAVERRRLERQEADEITERQAAQERQRRQDAEEAATRAAERQQRDREEAEKRARDQKLAAHEAALTAYRTHALKHARASRYLEGCPLVRFESYTIPADLALEVQRMLDSKVTAKNFPAHGGEHDARNYTDAIGLVDAFIAKRLRNETIKRGHAAAINVATKRLNYLISCSSLEWDTAGKVGARQEVRDHCQNFELDWDDGHCDAIAQMVFDQFESNAGDDNDDDGEEE